MWPPGHARSGEGRRYARRAHAELPRSTRDDRPVVDNAVPQRVAVHDDLGGAGERLAGGIDVLRCRPPTGSRSRVGSIHATGGSGNVFGREQSSAPLDAKNLEVLDEIIAEFSRPRQLPESNVT